MGWIVCYHCGEYFSHLCRWRTEGAVTINPDRSIPGDNPFLRQTEGKHLRRPVGLRFAPDGSLYVLVRDAWVIDRNFQPGTGSILKIDYDATRVGRP